MNNKQLIPLLVKLGVVGGIIWGFYSLFSESETEKKPEITPTNAGTENRRKESETALKTTRFRLIPLEIKPAATPVSAVIPVNSALIASKIPTPTQSATILVEKSMTQAPLFAIKRKLITREDMATVFHHGARALTRKDAVSALTALGFGKSAAYEALSASGRFIFCLEFAPDGIITWKN